MTGKPDHKHEELSRRRFLARLAKAGASVAAVSAGAWYLRDPLGPGASESDGRIAALPDYSVPEAGKHLAIATGPDRARAVEAALGAIGGIGKFIRSGDKVLLKVNAAFATPPLLSATSHPDLVVALAQLCRKAGAAEVLISDNPINDPDSCFRLTGIAGAAEKSGSRLILPRPQFFKPYTLDNAVLINDWPLLHEPLQGVTKVIGVAPVKDHNRAGASMTMKNWYGLLGGRRNTFHQDINTIITELARMVRPTLVVLDGTTAMMSNGPTGGSTADLKQTNTMIVSTDQVAADAFGCTLLGRSPADLPYIAMAAAAGCGTADYKSLKPARVEAES